MSYTSKCGTCGHLANVHVPDEKRETFGCQFCGCTTDSATSGAIPVTQSVAERLHPDELTWIHRRWS